MAEKAITKRCRRIRPNSCGTVAGVWPTLASFADVAQSVFGPSGPPRQDEIAARLRCSPRSARRTLARPTDRSRVLADSRDRSRWGNALRIWNQKPFEYAVRKDHCPSRTYVFLVVHAPGQLPSLAGQEHGRNIPLSDICPVDRPMTSREY
jgi:hypothetical protein